MAVFLVILFTTLFIALVVAVFVLPIYLLRKHKNKKLKSDVGECEVCKKTALKLQQTSIRGVVIVAEYGHYKRWLCLEHGQMMYEEIKNYNLQKGWWSLYGVLRTPFVMQENHYEFSRFSKELSKIS